MNQTQVYLVGAGPGDIELITVKGLRILSQADVILCDHLISRQFLSHVKEDAEIICVGKRASRHTLPQNEINKLIIEKAKAGKRVVRLKGGDCCLFGRGGEEAKACYEAGIEFEIVPGVTSALAAPCCAGIPPTHRDYTSDVAIVTGHRKKGDDRPISIPRAGTVIFLMAVANIANIIKSLLEAGYAKGTKIAAIERGTCYDQRVIEGTLDNFLDVIKNKPLRTPAVLIAGKVVELREQLDWFSRKPVVLHLGTSPRRYDYLGTIVHRPIINCIELPDNERMRRSIRSAGDYDWLIFTSKNAVRFFFKKRYAMGLDSRSFSSTKFAVIGRTTAEKLLEYGIKTDLRPAVESSTGLLEEFEKIDIAGRKILLPGAKVSSPELPEGLSNKSANVEKLAVYETVEKEMDPVDLDYIDKILFTSGSTVRAFVKQCPSLPKHIQPLCLGVPTQTVAKQYNINAKIIK